MALTSSAFKQRYPEFDNVDADQIADAIAEQDRNTSDTWAAADRDDIVALKTAHVLAISPLGRNARLATGSKRDEEVRTTYQLELERRIKAHACANLRIL